jgi:hypothetical protein
VLVPWQCCSLAWRAVALRRYGWPCCRQMVKGSAAATPATFHPSVPDIAVTRPRPRGSKTSSASGCHSFPSTMRLRHVYFSHRIPSLSPFSLHASSSPQPHLDGAQSPRFQRYKEFNPDQLFPVHFFIPRPLSHPPKWLSDTTSTRKSSSTSPATTPSTSIPEGGE